MVVTHSVSNSALLSAPIAEKDRDALLIICQIRSLRGKKLLYVIRNHGSLEEARVHACMKHHRIGERELPDIVMIEHAVVHEFIGFFKNRVHRRNIPVAYIRTKEVLAKFDTIERKRSDLRAEFEAMANERRRLALRLNELEGTTAALRQTASTDGR